MLRTLAIRNFAIIDHLDLELGPGLNVLTGETGAGKSIIIEALNCILGARSSADIVRSGAQRAAVDAVFDLSASPRAAEVAAGTGCDLDDGLLLISREVTAAGKSAARLAGRPCTAAQLKEVGDWLVDLHGQHEHQSLLAVARHVDVLDEWGGPDVLRLREQAAAAHAEVRALQSEQDALTRDARERAHLVDLYTFQLKEIGDADPQPGEDDQLREDAARLSNSQRLAQAAAEAGAALTGDDGGGVLERLAAASRLLEETAALDGSLAPIAQAVSGARYELEEAARDLQRYEGEIEHNPERLQQATDRLEVLRTLQRKYGDTLEDVLDFARETAVRLDALTRSEERGAEVAAALEAATQRLCDACAALTARRRSLADAFAEAVRSELADLAMERTRLAVSVEPAAPGPLGADRVEFLISANPGEPLRPLARIASGGEVSRVMLALKSAMARQEPLPTMVFDEIDVGVGGRTAGVIAAKLAALAASAQVLCITHLPQIAARGSTHFYIEKRPIDDRVVTRVSKLDAAERVEEIARMLGGTDVTDTVRSHAREMLAAGAP